MASSVGVPASLIAVTVWHCLQLDGARWGLFVVSSLLCVALLVGLLLDCDTFWQMKDARHRLVCLVVVVWVVPCLRIAVRQNWME